MQADQLSSATGEPHSTMGRSGPPHRYATLLLQVWREACRHIDLADSVSRIAAVLARKIPLDRLVVRQLDPQRSCLETLAVGSPDGRGLEVGRVPLTEAQLEQVLAWSRERQVRRIRARGTKDSLSALLASGMTGELVVGPLQTDQGATGVMILHSSSADAFDDEHLAMAAELLEPLSVAMENDARVREVNALREAAEADKRTLLTRLGREDLTDSIVGADSGLREVMERVRLVCNSDVPVMILGETGSGKEVVARAIHTRSRRASRPFLRVNCGAIPPELIDSELFGHEKGSFTGAETTRQGWFERADTGTLFLDEVGELPLAAQVRLLRVLQDGSFERVGGSKPLHADVRIIAATHRDLRAMVADGRFREDLWYRIAVFPIVLPSLRERPQDVPSLATHFALKAARRFGTSSAIPTPEDMSLLVSYPWPGNVRELAAVMERAVILGNGRTLEVAKALGTPQAGTAPPPAVRTPSFTPEPRPAPEGRPAPEAEASLDAAMVRHIEAALAKCLGRIEGPFGAAKALGINPHTLRARMRKLGIEWQRYRQGAAENA